MQALLALALLQVCGGPAGLAQPDRKAFSLLAALRAGLMANNDDYVGISEPVSPDPPAPAPSVSRVNEPDAELNRTKLGASSLIKNWNHSFADRFVVIKNPDQPGDPRVPTLDVGFSQKRNESGELNEDYKEDSQAFGYREETRGNSSADPPPYVTQQVYAVGYNSPAGRGWPAAAPGLIRRFK